MDENTYKVYDNVVCFLMKDIMEKTENSKDISLSHLCTSDHAHLTILWAAMYAASLTDKQVALNVPLMDYMRFKIDNPHMKNWYRMNTHEEPNIDVAHEIDLVYEKVEGAEILKNGLGCIYDEYYTPGKDLKN